MEILSVTPPPSPTKTPTVPKKKKKKKNKCPCIIDGEVCNAAISIAVGYCKWCNTVLFRSIWFFGFNIWL